MQWHSVGLLILTFAIVGIALVVSLLVREMKRISLVSGAMLADLERLREILGGFRRSGSEDLLRLKCMIVDDLLSHEDRGIREELSRLLGALSLMSQQIEDAQHSVKKYVEVATTECESREDLSRMMGTVRMMSRQLSEAQESIDKYVEVAKAEHVSREVRSHSDEVTEPDAPVRPYASLSAIACEGRGCFGEGAFGIRDPVDCTVCAPSAVSIGESLLVQVFVHLPEQAMKAEAAARESDSESHRRAITSLGTEVARGSRLSFELTVRNLRIFDPVQEVTWQGHIDCVQFEVEVPTDANPGAVVATVTASQDSVPIGNLRFKLLLVDGVCKSRQEPRGMATRYDLAFISYASADRLEVLRRIQVLSAVGIRYFQDLLNLEPGDAWRDVIFRHIDESNVMFLFWSTRARDSDWVEMEWRYALKTKTDPQYIRPVIIEGPPPIPPPLDLAYLHFNDKILYIMKAC